MQLNYEQGTGSRIPNLLQWSGGDLIRQMSYVFSSSRIIPFSQTKHRVQGHQDLVVSKTNVST
jgi:hypothetical protein